MLLHKDDFSGLWDKNKTPIYAGDTIKITGCILNGLNTGICRFSAKEAAYGLEFPHGDTTEFYPFCQMCNIEYEVITPTRSQLNATLEEVIDSAE